MRIQSGNQIYVNGQPMSADDFEALRTDPKNIITRLDTMNYSLTKKPEYEQSKVAYDVIHGINTALRMEIAKKQAASTQETVAASAEEPVEEPALKAMYESTEEVESESLVVEVPSDEDITEEGEAK